MKANELRVGNKVQVLGIYKDSYKMAGFISVDAEFIYLVDQGKIGALPIPLTPEILGRCGFDLEAIQLRVPGHTYEFLFDIQGLKYGYNGDSGFIKETRKPIEYLHQLQNLIFALTGEEINYTP